MTNFSELRVFLCMTPTSMNFSFDRLMGIAERIFNQDPLSGHLFLFVNRYRNRIKILYWDRDGFCIWYKRLENAASLKCRPAAQQAWNSTTNSCRDCWAASICAAGAAVNDDIVALVENNSRNGLP